MSTETLFAPAAESSATSARKQALIGPHAIIHSVAVIRERLGTKACEEILENAQIRNLPSGQHMIEEIAVLRLHRWLALREPVACFAIAEEAAKRTAQYIIANRIPKPVVSLLKALPAALAGPILMNKIRQHAWTFIGAGRFEPKGAWSFEIDRSQVDDPVVVPDSLFHWYAMVFEHLYAELVSPDCKCEPRLPVGSNPKSLTYCIRRG